jgi:alpha-galactosidase
LFGSFGIEWDVTGCSPDELAELAGWVALAKRFRPLLHGGRTVRVDHPDPALWAHGVIAPDRSEALFALVTMERSLTWPPGRVRLPGLDPGTDYRLTPVGPRAGTEPVSGRSRPAWWSGGLVHSGRVLGAVGVLPPALHPDQAVLVHLGRA